MDFLLHPSTLAIVFHVVIVAAISIRVVMMRPLPGVALAWLLMVGLMPIVGAAIYLSIGERRISRARVERYETQRPVVRDWVHQQKKQGSRSVDWSRHPPTAQRMSRLGESAAGLPTLIGNKLLLISDTEQILRSIIRDIECAKSTIHMAFYIWHPGGTADEVVEAVIAARARGVRCRILVDALGGAKWLRGKLVKRLREAGVEVREALPVGLFGSLVARGDLRLHRKIVVVDGEVAYTGSMNLVDPRYFKQGSGVGQWVDAMARVEGPAAEALLGSMLSDWQREGGDDIPELIATSDLRHLAPVGNADVQTITSGPGEGVPDGILQMLMMMFYAASKEIIITTPYFVPDDSMLRALRAAAGRGVRVELIVPAKVDSLLVRYASRSYFDDLTEVGVTIQQYDGGLLHTKSITVDGCISMFGTVNLDMRSIWLNYELSLFVYDQDFGGRLRDLQLEYLKSCTAIDRDAWLARSRTIRFAENVARLVSPLL